MSSEKLEITAARSSFPTAKPFARAPVVGVYRFWRDMGYAVGALIAGATADALGYGGAITLVAGLTAVSGFWVLVDMPTPPIPHVGATDGADREVDQAAASA